MKTKKDYLDYVHSVINEVRATENVPKASYDTGFGIHITNEHLGDSPMTLFVVQHSIARVKPPEIENSDEWDEAWQAGKALINRFVSRYEEGL